MGESITLKKDAELVDFSSMTAEEKKHVQEIVKQIDIEDSQAVVTFGLGAQKDISDFADSTLEKIRSKDSGYVGEVLTDLVEKVQEVDVDSLSESSIWSKIPFLGSIKRKIKRFISRYSKLDDQIDKIVDELEKARMTLLKDITLLDNMFDKNQNYLRELDLYIAAGQMKLNELQQKTLPEMQAKAEASKDPVDAQKFRDFNQFLNRFEKKLHDLKLSRTIAIQTSPQLRLIQNGDQTLVEKIQSSILNTIPLWKNQIVIAITLFRQKKAIKLQKKVSEATNEILKKNAELLKQGAVDIAVETERGIVDMETLKKVNTDLISTLEEVMKIQEEGRAKRKQAEVELVQMEKELKDKLVSIK
ncbi:toxic anion resistance protein [Acidobacteriota bacterium]